MAAKDEYFHPLALDERGAGFPLPGDARYWLVHRMPPRRGKSAPVNTEDGFLLVDIKTPSVEALKQEIRATPSGLQGGRYKLIPVDEQRTQVGKLCAYTAPLPAEETSEPDAEEAADGGALNGRDAVIVKLADRIAAKDEKLFEQYVSLATRSVAVAEKALEALSKSQCDLIKGYAQVRPVTLEPEYLDDGGEGGADEKDFFERVANAGPAMQQLLNAWMAFQASRRDNMTAAAVAAAAGVAGATVDANGTNGTNGVHVGIKPPTSNGSNGQGT